MKLQTTDGPHAVLDLAAHKPILDLPDTASLEEEIDAMIQSMEQLDPGMPDQIIVTCMALMARCTELWVLLIRIEARERRAKAFRTTQLQKTMDLIDFTYKAASRLIEVRRQDVELSR